MRIFTMIEKDKNGPSDRILRYQGRKVKKYGTKYQKVGPNSNLIYFL